MAEDATFIEKNLSDICASVQHTIVTYLLSKLKKAAMQTGIKNIAISGGVAANSGLRKDLEIMAEKENWQTYIPAFEYCTDNAAMIAIAGYYKYMADDIAGLEASSYASVKK